MTDKKVWFITGAGRGMGVDFVKAALPFWAEQANAFLDLSTSLAVEQGAL